jgi:hypothetical protein
MVGYDMIYSPISELTNILMDRSIDRSIDQSNKWLSYSSNYAAGGMLVS